jgi:hypothetical protein
MRYMVIALALAAVPAAAQNQASPWQYFEPAGGTMQAGVVNAQGAQLIIKCDKPGKGQVFAVVVTPEKLVPPLQPAVRHPRARAALRHPRADRGPLALLRELGRGDRPEADDRAVALPQRAGRAHRSSTSA